MSTPQPVVMANLDSRHEAVDWERMGRFLLSEPGLPAGRHRGTAGGVVAGWLG